MALERSHLIAAGITAGLPMTLAGVLALVRPDLMAPMLRHVFGYAAVLATVLLAILGGGAMLLGWWLVDRFVRQERRLKREILICVVAGVSFILFTFPALFIVLFSPIVFAYAFGGSMEY